MSTVSAPSPSPRRRQLVAGAGHSGRPVPSPGEGGRGAVGSLPVRRSRRRALTVTVAWAVVTFLAVNVAVRAYLSWSPVRFGDRFVAAAWQAALEGDQLLVVVGDSTCLHAVDAARLSARTGLATANLCTGGDQLAVDDALMVAARVERGRPPRAVVVIHAVNTWPRGAEAFRVRPAMPYEEVGASGRFADVLDLPSTAERAARWLVPLWFEDRSVKTLLSHPSRIPERRRPRGAVGSYAAVGPLPDRVRAEVPGRAALLPDYGAVQALSARPPVSELNERALGLLAELGASHGFPVIVIAPPAYEGLLAEPRVAAYLGALRARLAELEATYPALVVGLADPVPFPAGVMQNVDHLADPAATAAYTDLVADVLARLGVGPGTSG